MDETDDTLVRPDNYVALAAFRRALRRFLAFSEAAAGAEGIPPQQHQALLAIKGHPGAAPIGVGALADALAIRHNTAVELSDRMAVAGLLAREPAPDDRRRIQLRLTPKAEAVLARLSAAHLAELRQTTPLLIDLLRRFQAPG